MNSLKNKLDYIEDEIERFEEQNGQTLHFVALTETKIPISEVEDYKITHYKSFFKISPDAYGGVALYVHRSLRCSELISQNHVLTNCKDLRHKVSIRNTSFSDHRNKIHITFD